MEKFKKSWEFHGRTLTVENGEIAKQAGGSVLVRYEDTVVLSAATASNVARRQDPRWILKKRRKTYRARNIDRTFN